MDATEPSRGSFSFVHGDFEVNWARNHSQCVCGQVPAAPQVCRAHITTHCVFSEADCGCGSAGFQSFDDHTLISILQTHINTQVYRHEGKVRPWDVINESLNDDGEASSCCVPSQLRSVKGTYRDNVWYKTIGPAYIPLALGFARAADPNAQRCISMVTMRSNNYETSVADLSHFCFRLQY